MMKATVVLRLSLAACVMVAAAPARADDRVEGPKAAVCHRPPGNPAKAKTLCIAESSVADHLQHGDTAGECPAPPAPDASTAPADAGKDEGDSGKRRGGQKKAARSCGTDRSR